MPVEGRVTLLHNPACSKSRKALELLEREKVKLMVVPYLKLPPTADELDAICTRLGVHPKALVRSGDAAFAELGLSLDDDRSRRGWLEILAADPRLLQRPIALTPTRAVIGRPPERVLELLL